MCVCGGAGGAGAMGCGRGGGWNEAFGVEAGGVGGAEKPPRYGSAGGWVDIWGPGEGWNDAGGAAENCGGGAGEKLASGGSGDGENPPASGSGPGMLDVAFVPRYALTAGIMLCNCSSFTSHPSVRPPLARQRFDV